MLNNKQNRIISVGMGFLILCACGLFQPMFSNEIPGGDAFIEQTATSSSTSEKSSTPTKMDSDFRIPTSGAIEETIIPTGHSHIENPQIGLNFIRLFWSERRGGQTDTRTPYFQPEWIFADFEELGIQVYRQFVRADLLWNIVEPANDEWDFKAADKVLFLGASPEPIATLFAMQYASPTPPWVKDSAQFQKTIGPEAEDYLKTVVQRYASVVRFWEIGNEMNHWRAADSNELNLKGAKPPPLVPPGGFSPQEQGIFFAQAATLIHHYDPDAVIVMPGMGGLDEYVLNVWLPGVIEGSDTEWFDVVNYHFYGSWERYGRLREGLLDAVNRLGIEDKPIWLTETGVTANPENTVRTNYPNTPEAQAADIFRRIVPAYGHGDALVIWHTYISSPVTDDNSWGLYGIRTDAAEELPSYYAMQLLIDELIPFERVETLSNDLKGLNCYRITTHAGEVRYVVWGRGIYVIPDGVREYTSVVPATDGEFSWQSVQVGASLPVSEIPILLH